MRDYRSPCKNAPHLPLLHKADALWQVMLSHKYSPQNQEDTRGHMRLRSHCIFYWAIFFHSAWRPGRGLIFACKIEKTCGPTCWQREDTFTEAEQNYLAKCWVGEMRQTHKKITDVQSYKRLIIPLVFVEVETDHFFMDFLLHKTCMWIQCSMTRYIYQTFLLICILGNRSLYMILRLHILVVLVGFGQYFSKPHFNL